MSPENAGARGVVFRPKQLRFLTVSDSPICYWLAPSLFSLAGAGTKRLGDYCEALEGLGTRDDARFIRYWWETSGLAGFVPLAKGGGYRKWYGDQDLKVAWGKHGERLKAYNSELYGGGHWSRQIRNTHRYGQHGLTYTDTARGALGVRELRVGTIFGEKGPAIFVEENKLFDLLAVLNCRLTSYLLRTLSPSLQFRIGYLLTLGIDLQRANSALGTLAQECIRLKEVLGQMAGPESANYWGGHWRGQKPESLTAAAVLIAEHYSRAASVLHCLEGIIEREVFTSYDVTDQDLNTVIGETGTPAGWQPLLAGYDVIPSPPGDVKIDYPLVLTLKDHPRLNPTLEKLAELKHRLGELYEAGPGGSPVADDESGPNNDDEEDEESPVSGAHIPIPAETFLEELSQSIEIHPISVYWLLRELREKDGVVCMPELRRFVSDHFTVTILRMLGHRWPKQIEANEPVPDWAEPSGIIPITKGISRESLISWVRKRIAADFGAERAPAIEREFEEIMGASLETWLARDFSRNHVSQFRKRPIAWQLQSEPRTITAAGKTRSRKVALQRKPLFSCLIYYHRLEGLLPLLVSDYLGPLRKGLQVERDALTRLDKRTGEQDARRQELELQLEELNDFIERVERIIDEGFASAGLQTIVTKEPLDKWTSRDGKVPAPSSVEAFLVQERRYDPDINDGVRVNIAPLQKAGLLAADVLAAKDIDKAIADRAQWRADERRWCREGKLPRPGWWKE